MNTAVGGHFLLQGTFLTQGSNPPPPALASCTGRWILYHWATRKAIPYTLIQSAGVSWEHSNPCRHWMLWMPSPGRKLPSHCPVKKMEREASWTSGQQVPAGKVQVHGSNCRSFHPEGRICLQVPHRKTPIMQIWQVTEYHLLLLQATTQPSPL